MTILTPQLETLAALRWPSYHIENYLIQPRFILKVLQDVGRAAGAVSTSSMILQALRVSAVKTIPSLIRHRLQMKIDRQIRRAVELRIDRTSSDVGPAMADAVDRSLKRLRAEAFAGLSGDEIRRLAIELDAEARAEIACGDTALSRKGCIKGVHCRARRWIAIRGLQGPGDCSNERG